MQRLAAHPLGDGKLLEGAFTVSSCPAERLFQTSPSPSLPAPLPLQHCVRMGSGVLGMAAPLSTGVLSLLELCTSPMVFCDFPWCFREPRQVRWTLAVMQNWVWSAGCRESTMEQGG